MPKFDDEAAVEIAYGENKVSKFEDDHPECTVMVTKISPKDTQAWIKKNPKANVGTDVKNLWLVELEDPGNEKLVVIISPITKKIVEIKTEAAEALPEEEDEED
ncbi:MAG: hypothetical protein ACFFCM_10630 [Promethearchaeota archaeon]